MSEHYIIVRGGGDLATGVIHRLFRCGYKVLILECEKPSAIRRKVAFCEAVYDGEAFVEGVLCSRIEDISQCRQVWEKRQIPLLVDPEAACLKTGLDGQTPAALIDGIIAKKNLGTRKEMAPVTIGLGPGFLAGEDVDYVVETMRGHDLGRIIEDDYAQPNTGVPGMVGGSKQGACAPFSGGRDHPCKEPDCRSGGEGTDSCLCRRSACTGFNHRCAERDHT